MISEERKCCQHLNKYYLTDAGLGRIRNSGFKLEVGAMLENVVYNELLIRGYEVYVGKTTKGEIDFIAVKNDVREYYQVAYILADENVIEREFGAFRFVPDNFPKYVLSIDHFDFSRAGIIHKTDLYGYPQFVHLLFLNFPDLPLQYHFSFQAELQFE